MAERKLTAYQRLQALFSGGTPQMQNVGNIYKIDRNPNTVIDTAGSREEYDRKVLQLRQQKLLSNQWKRATNDINNNMLAGLNDVKLMYRDVDIMDGFPEIGTALDIYVEEACCTNDEGCIVNVTSNSERVKSILQDLFVNRLSINATLPMVTRAMCKYGNCFMLLNTDASSGVMGWKEFPVYEIERYENGMRYPYAANVKDDGKPEDTRFVWVNQSQSLAYRNWQIGHFRLLYDSQFLPYGVSSLHKARRHFRMLSMMEDAMLIYRLDRSMERRVFRVNVGGIDEQDVPAYLDDIANNFKRTPIVDPLTGQLDLKKSIMNGTDDFFIPYRPGEENVNPIEILAGGQNLTAMDDIKFVQNKLMTALRVPKSFLNFEEEKGDGKNLSMLDVRFTRTVNRVQQSLLMELNKIAIIHLYLLGFTDELTNFKLTMNNPSSQAEMLEIENLAKKVTTAKDAVSDPGGGVPLTSLTWAWRHIFKWSDKEIQRNLEEIRLEFALAAELQKTMQIIKRTGLFDTVDNVYGEPGAQYSEDMGGGEGGPEGPGGPGGPGGGGLPPMGGGDMDFGDEGDMGPDMGAEGEMPMGDAAMEDGAMGGPGMSTGSEPPLGEAILNAFGKKLITEKEKVQSKLKAKGERYQKILTDRIIERLSKSEKPKNEVIVETAPLYDKSFFINEELDNIKKELDSLIETD